MRRYLAVLLLLTACTTHTAPTPAATTTHAATTASSVDLPDHTLTPGATDPAVTQATIDSTVCVHGYTTTVRNVPSSERRQVFTAYRIDYALHARYELDHLISLELGGSNAASNLWPEPYAGTEGARVKDRTENRLHTLVCSGALTLATAQHAIATDWQAAAKQYG